MQVLAKVSQLRLVLCTPDILGEERNPRGELSESQKKLVLLFLQVFIFLATSSEQFSTDPLWHAVNIIFDVTLSR